MGNHEVMNAPSPLKEGRGWNSNDTCRGDSRRFEPSRFRRADYIRSKSVQHMNERLAWATDARPKGGGTGSRAVCHSSRQHIANTGGHRRGHACVWGAATRSVAPAPKPFVVRKESGRLCGKRGAPQGHGPPTPPYAAGSPASDPGPRTRERGDGKIGMGDGIVPDSGNIVTPRWMAGAVAG